MNERQRLASIELASKWVKFAAKSENFDHLAPPVRQTLEMMTDSRAKRHGCIEIVYPQALSDLPRGHDDPKTADKRCIADQKSTTRLVRLAAS